MARQQDNAGKAPRNKGVSSEIQKTSRTAAGKLAKQTMMDAGVNPARPKLITGDMRTSVVLPVEGGEGAILMQKMHGYSTIAGYRVLAVKGTAGIVSAKRLNRNLFKVKFYPNFEFWGISPNRVKALGAKDFNDRSPYQRFLIPKDGMIELLSRLTEEAAALQTINDPSNMKVTTSEKMMLKCVPEDISGGNPLIENYNPNGGQIESFNPFDEGEEDKFFD
jgi:hypothetical protein